jgi:hypothetical protein
VAGNGNGALTRGPVGAGGLRPMLGGRGAVGGGAAGGAKPAGEQSPTHRVPGSSVAARAAATVADVGTWADVARRVKSSGTATPPLLDEGSGCKADSTADVGGTIDDDGFQTVARRGTRKGAARSQQGGEAHHAQRSETTTTNNDGLGASGNAGGDDDDRDGDGAEGQPTTADLHQAWLDEVAVVRRLRQQGLPSGHPAMVAACAARDAAEGAWRGSKDPAPASVRLGRAQAKLDRAVAVQGEARQAMLEAERLHRVHMEGLQATLDEATERVRTRRSQLREVQDEVAADGTSGRANIAQQQAMRQVHSTICDEVGPTIAALVEQLDSSTPAWAALNGLLGRLSTSKEVLESACGGTQGAQAYNIGDGADQWEGWSEWSESHERGDGPLGDGNARPEGRQEDRVQDGCGATQGYQADATDWWGGPARRWGSGARWQECGHGDWRRASWADQMEVEHDEAGEADLQPAPARRRLEPISTDMGTHSAQPAQRQEQQEPQQQPPAGDDASERKRRHEARVSQIVAMAIDSGVNPLTADGEELQLLDPPRLDAWVSEHLPAALLC